MPGLDPNTPFMRIGPLTTTVMPITNTHYNGKFPNLSFVQLPGVHTFKNSALISIPSRVQRPHMHIGPVAFRRPFIT